MSQPKLPPGLRAEIAALGLTLNAYQPVHRFKADPPRRLSRVARDDDPWHVTLFRSDRACWADGALVGTAEGDTLEAAVRSILPGGLLAGMKKLGSAVDRLTGVIRAQH